MFRNRTSLLQFALLATMAVGMAQLPRCAFPQDPGAPKPATTQSATPPSQSPATPAALAPTKTTEKTKPKKVWTNDELGSVKGKVSVVGEGNQSTESWSNSTTNARERSFHQQKLDYYRSQLAQLHSQIDAADKRIGQLKDFKAENTSASGGIKINQGYNMMPVEEQVKQLENKKKEWQAKIDDLENEARKSGIEPGDLR
jgi:hypothetical protein